MLEMRRGPRVCVSVQLSVCPPVCLYFGYNREPNKNRKTDQGAVWTPVGRGNHASLFGGGRIPRERGNFSGLPPARYEKGKGSPYSITERRVPELIPVLGCQPAGDVCHKPGGRLPLLSARPAVTPQPLRGLLPILPLGEQRHDWCEQFA